MARFLFAVDPTARTSGVVVSVDDHYQSAIPGKRPPLLTNMYVKVELRAPPREDFIIVPPTAVFEGLVYIVDHNRRLQAPNHLRPSQTNRLYGDPNRDPRRGVGGHFRSDPGHRRNVSRADPGS